MEDEGPSTYHVALGSALLGCSQPTPLMRLLLRVPGTAWKPKLAFRLVRFRLHIDVNTV